MWLLSWITGGALKTVAGYLTKLSDGKTQIALAEVNAEIESRRNARDVRLATKDFWEMRLMTGVVLGIFTFHLCLIALDTFTTGTRWEIKDWNVPAFPSPIHEWEGAIILSLFGLNVANKTISAVTTIISKIFGK